MSGRKRDVAIRIAVEEVEAARRKLEQLGTDGQKALDRIGLASKAAEPGMQKLAGASDAAVKSIGGFAGAIPGAERAVGVLGGALTSSAAGYAALGLAAGAATVAIARAGDAMTASLARLGAATGSPDSAVRVYERLYQLSQQTGVSVAESADAFARFAVAARQVGATNDQVLGLVKTIQQAGIVSGASVEETKSATLQLGQALASGVLQGDELRSLLESMPVLAEKLSGQLGVSVGELRKMGAEGKLTADTVLPALLRAGEQINEEFGKMPVTMGRAFDILGGAMTSFAANLDKALGLSEAIAKAAMAAAGAVNGVRRAVLPSEMERADSAITAAQDRIRQLDSQSADGRGAAPLPQFGQRRGQDAVDDVRGAREQAQRDLIDAIAAKNQLLRQDREMQAAEEADAAAKRLANQREQGAKEGKALAESLDAKQKARSDYAETIGKIDKLEMAGSYSTAEAARLRTLAQEKLNEALAKGVKAEAEIVNGKRSFDDIVAFYNAEADKADAKAEAEYKRQQDKLDRQAENTTDSIVQYAGEKFADLFSSTGGGWAKLMDNLKTTAVATFARIAAEALIRPIVMPIVASLVGGSGTGSSGGLGGLLGGGGSGSGGSSIFSSLGQQFGLGDSFSGFLNTTLWEGPGSIPLASAANTTVGSLAGGVGAGFAAGSFIGGMINPQHQTGASIGAGAGALAGAAIGSIIPGVGTVIGGLIGGVLGGTGGSFIGPGPAHHGYSWGIQGNGTGGFGLTDRVFVDPIAQQQFAAEQQQIAQANALLGKYGVGVSGLIEVGGTAPGMGGRNDRQVDSFGSGFGAFRFSASNDNQLNRVLDGRSFSGLSELGEAIGYIKETLPALLHPVSAFDDSMKKLTTTFDDALTLARKYGEAEQDLTDKRAERVADLTASRDASASSITASLALRYARATGGSTTAASLAGFDAAAIQEKLDLKSRIFDLGLADTEYAASRILDIEKTLAAERLAITKSYADQSRGLLSELTLGGSSALAPEQKYFAGLTLLNNARQQLEGGGAVADYISVAQQVLPVARDFLGTSERYAALTADVAGTLTRNGGDPSGLGAILQAQVDGQDVLAATFAQYGAAQVDIGNATLAEIKRMVSTLEALIARKAA